MVYRGAEFTVAQDVGRDTWRWTVNLNEHTSRVSANRARRRMTKIKQHRDSFLRAWACSDRSCHLWNFPDFPLLLRVILKRILCASLGQKRILPSCVVWPNAIRRRPLPQNWGGASPQR